MRYIGIYQQFYIFNDQGVYRALDETGASLTADSMSSLRAKINQEHHGKPA